MLELMLATLGDVLTVDVVSHIALGVFIGYLVGALPGMNRATAIAVALPFTFTMSALSAICFLIGINKGGAAGSAVSAILINVPGEPSSVVTTIDGYPLTRQGKSQKALKMGLLASVIGDVLATMTLILIAAPLANLALGIGPVELAAILLFAITFIAAVSGHSFFKGIMSGLLGLFVATPGIDVETGIPRLTFGFYDLYDGVPLLAVAIGTLALSEMLVQIDKGWRGNYAHSADKFPAGSKEDRELSLAEIRECMPTILRSSLIGIVLGLLPGLGASISSFMSYAVARKRSKHPERFGKGALEGVAAAESADNATVPASLIPVFAIGVPGSLSTALLMGAFMLHGLTPGPLIFRDDANVVFGIYNGMILAALLLFLIGYVGQSFFAKIIQAPDTMISPVVVLLCVGGAYVEGGGMFNVYLMMVFAFVGYFMKKFDFSFVTFLVGFILGPMMELTLRQSLILTDNNPAKLLDHPIAIVFLVLAVVSVVRLSSVNLLRLDPATVSEPTDRV
jgi:putative tricarboxylic transport membrane protein